MIGWAAAAALVRSPACRSCTGLMPQSLHSTGSRSVVELIPTCHQQQRLAILWHLENNTVSRQRHVVAGALGCFEQERWASGSCCCCRCRCLGRVFLLCSRKQKEKGRAELF